MTRYAESDDLDFFNKYAKVKTDAYPYFDPIAGIFRIETHHHSNVATARKGTFFRSWRAALSDTDSDGLEVWKLEPGYLDIIKKKALTKAGKVTKVPAIPLAGFLFRQRGFPDESEIGRLGDELKREFNLTDEEYEALFEDLTAISEFESSSPLTEADVLAAIQESGGGAPQTEDRASFQTLSLREDDPIVSQVRLLLADEYAGVVFVGPPGTSKSWYAVQVALALADGEPSRVRKIQFHKSFQYEHFVEGFVPNPEGTGFELREQLMLNVIRDASENPATYVVLIDELSRSDPGRVFGELLTYMEPSRRDESFTLASGREISMGANIVFIATMNSRDKSVLDIDDAFDRRMAKIEFSPSESILTSFLVANGVDDALQRRIVGFFQWVNGKYPLGHTFFRTVRDLEGLKRLWNTQLRFVFEKQFRYEKSAYEEIENKFVEITGVTLR
jgi:5-methylcytosine-specific restriction protein B